jgi:hypothetical protein
MLEYYQDNQPAADGPRRLISPNGSIPCFIARNHDGQALQHGEKIGKSVCSSGFSPPPVRDSAQRRPCDQDAADCAVLGRTLHVVILGGAGLVGTGAGKAVGTISPESP